MSNFNRKSENGNMFSFLFKDHSNNAVKSRGSDVIHKFPSSNGHSSSRMSFQKRTGSKARHYGSSNRKWSSSYLSVISDVGDDSAFYSVEYHETLNLTIGLCRDYICNRLKRSGFGCKVYVTKYAPASDQSLAFQLLSIGYSFENTYPNLNKNISRKIGYVFDSEATIRRLYFRLATHIVGLHSENFTWGRILSLFCIAGAMAVDCVSQGHAELVEEMIKISSDFIRQNVLDWIIEQGGWTTLSKHFTKRKPIKKTWCPYHLKEVGCCSTSMLVCGIFALGSLTVHICANS